MSSTNPFDLLGDDDNDDPSQLIAAQQQKLPSPPKKSPAPVQDTATQPSKPAKLPSKPLPPAQAVRETTQTRNEGQRGGGRGGGRGSGRGRGGFNRDSVNNENSFGSNNGFSGGYRPTEEGDAGKPSERRGYGGPRGGFRGGRRGGLSNGEVAEGERPRRVFERHSGTGRGNETKRDGAGRGNWGIPTDDIAPETEEPVNDNEKNVDAEKQLGQEDAGDANKEKPVIEPEEKEPEDKEMTLEEYEKLLEEKRKALLAQKTEERKVDLDKEFESMQLLSSKKDDHDIFIKLGSDKDKRKEAAEREERAKKSVSINEFLKPAEGERHYNPGGRGRGRGRGRGLRGGFSGSNMMNNVEAPAIEDVGQFPSLGSK
ncbi:hypothetical protein F0562_012853 [Nyssa sinensis]|uniref:Hyaluronan/mRNA-binding protein domain-containing protein n=1 Tax=Nyssa sinensis TaxID=561372 RepID=A0A5J4ZV02_9ASTE|nr:hypothetical protein F0562_012853 [Nyssa sinensis]